MLQIHQTNSNTATPLLDRLVARLDDRTELNQILAARATDLTAEWIRLNVGDHHRTAFRLGAAPTNYLSKMADGLRPGWSATEAWVEFPTDDTLEIFARVLGPVTVTAKNVKYLTIPAVAEAYGRRAIEFDDLKFVPFASGARALCRFHIEMVPGKRKAEVKKIVADPIYWLKPSVVLPADPTLLPDEEFYARAMERGALEYLKALAGEDDA